MRAIVDEGEEVDHDGNDVGDIILKIYLPFKGSLIVYQNLHFFSKGASCDKESTYLGALSLDILIHPPSLTQLVGSCWLS